MTFVKSKVLVVGGAGFIGGHLVQRLCGMNAVVTCLDVVKPTYLSDKFENLHCCYADLRDVAQLKSALSNSRFDYVFNFGGSIDHVSYRDGGRRVIDVHLVGMLNLLDNLDWSSLRAFIQVGSSDEYGNGIAPQVETQREAPFSPYSAAKTAAAHLLQSLFKSDRLPATILRFFLVYGPQQNQQRFIPQIIKGCLSDESFPTSEGKQLRDFCYIDDVIDAVLLAALNSNSRGQCLNIASGRPVAIRDVVATIQKIIGLGSPQFGEHGYRERENMALYANVKRAREILQWQPKVDLTTGLERTIAWYRQQFSFAHAETEVTI